MLTMNEAAATPTSVRHTTTPPIWAISRSSRATGPWLACTSVVGIPNIKARVKRVKRSSLPQVTPHGDSPSTCCYSRMIIFGPNSNQ